MPEASPQSQGTVSGQPQGALQPVLQPGPWSIELGPVRTPVRVWAAERAWLAPVAAAFGAPKPTRKHSTANQETSQESGSGQVTQADRRPAELQLSRFDDRHWMLRTAQSEYFAEGDGALVELMDHWVDEMAGDYLGPSLTSAVRTDPSQLKEQSPDEGGTLVEPTLLLHASSVLAPNGSAVVFVGPSGAGKSTTATLSALCGWPFLADECLALALPKQVDGEHTGRVLRWRRPLALRADVLKHLGELEERQGRAIRRVETSYKTYGFSSDVVSKTRRQSVPLGAWVRIDPSASDDGPDDPGALFRTLVEACHYFQAGGSSSFQILAQLSRSVPTYRLRARSGAAVFEQLRELLA